MENIQPGKLHAIKLLDIFITSTEDKQSFIFHHHHSEDKLKIITSLSQKPFGTGMQQTEKLVGILVTLLLLTLITLFANISKELIVLFEANVKEEIFQLNKDGH
jgi:hypothetical protein